MSHELRHSWPCPLCGGNCESWCPDCARHTCRLTLPHAPYPDNAGLLWCPACEAPWPECPEYEVNPATE